MRAIVQCGLRRRPEAVLAVHGREQRFSNNRMGRLFPGQMVRKGRGMGGGQACAASSRPVSPLLLSPLQWLCQMRRSRCWRAMVYASRS